VVRKKGSGKRHLGTSPRVICFLRTRNKDQGTSRYVVKGQRGSIELELGAVQKFPRGEILKLLLTYSKGGCRD